MTLLFFDGFETYGPAATLLVGMNDVYGIYDNGNAGRATGTIITSDRVGGGQALRIANGNNNAANLKGEGPQLALAGLSSEDDWVFGAAFRVVTTLGAANNSRPLFEFYDSDADRMAALRMDQDGTLTVVRHDTINSTQVLATASNAFTVDEWNFVELKIKFSITAGSFEVRVNGVSVASGSSVRTTSTSEERPSQLRFGTINGSTLDVDDFYVLNDQGTINNDFLGDIRVQRLRPNGVGSNEEFSRNSGTSNWGQLNETSEDDETTYVESNRLLFRDLYHYEDLPAAVDGIFGVIAKPVLRKNDAGTRTYVLMCSSDGVLGRTETLYPAGSYVRQAKIFETDPATGTFWTETSINSAQFGVEITS